MDKIHTESVKKVSAVSAKVMDYHDFAKKNQHLFQNPDGGIEVLIDEKDISKAEKIIASKLISGNANPDWSKTGVVFEDQYNLILRDAVKFPDDSFGTYYRLICKSGDPVGAAILPVFKGEVQLIKHFRHATRSFHLEIPRGAREPGCSLEETAYMELEEEIGGYSIKNIDLGVLHTSSGLTSESFQIFFSELSSVGEPAIKDGIVEIIPVSIEKLETMILSGEITDAATICAYTRAKLKKLI